MLVQLQYSTSVMQIPKITMEIIYAGLKQCKISWYKIQSYEGYTISPVKLKKTAPSCPEPEIVSTSLGEPGRQPVCRSTVAAGPPSGWGSLGSVAMTPQEPAVFPARHFPHSKNKKNSMRVFSLHYILTCNLKKN